MFLARKEMRYSKLRFGLIIGIMVLIAYVVFMLSGLARGLAEEFKKGVEDWNAQEIVLSEEANKTLTASQLTRDDLNDVADSPKASIGLYSGAIKGTQQNITIFGTQKNAFLIPKLTQGNNLSKENEILISQNLADTGYQIGDKIKIGQYNQDLTIVGIFPETYYTVSPVVYTDLDTWTELKFGNQSFAEDKDKPINAIATKEKATIEDQNDDFDVLSTSELIDNIPGYSAQNLTLDAMIYFLFITAAAVIGIFMYVITLQKTSIFGVLKAHGIRNWFIAKSLIAQSFMVGIIGVGIAMFLAYLTSLILPTAMPFAIIWSQWLLYSGVLILVAIIGGLFSVRTLTKVDPITAIGG
ncbi:ABC transporter permease [Tetragenococcus halophilus]|uniref:ABC transporter permease n=1 Tax=Tetragenococcus halophilus TaxID=51669 RepID=UPI001F2D1A9E|nr:ABC transporter permease [Tetragenococcus halophilus]MCF1685420.1 ABC transporter permease [Tetragenococcus halophilus]